MSHALHPKTGQGAGHLSLFPAQSSHPTAQGVIMLLWEGQAYAP